MVLAEPRERKHNGELTEWALESGWGLADNREGGRSSGSSRLGDPKQTLTNRLARHVEISKGRLVLFFRSPVQCKDFLWWRRNISAKRCSRSRQKMCMPDWRQTCRRLNIWQRQAPVQESWCRVLWRG
ncbi:hypothetical protein RRG08_027068 [Elysia crispata]|uniref:Uncharacterized protein n=1 Tax=Elysia crispata TaxID=231223 RepID=A0AAE1DG69_9GAST|nr:hypothetical protein RRG08_027068 [Elysia crispata]